MAEAPRHKGRVRARKQSESTPTLTTRKLALLEVLRRRGWAVRIASIPRRLPRAVAGRYPGIPADVRGFVSALRLCRSPNKTAWFLTVDDYARKRGAGFRWNEFELMSLEGAGDDPKLVARIRSFWDRHFPLMFAVHSDYDYLAVRLSDGVIVHGFAPEWEEPSRVAPSFAAFLAAVAREAEAQSGRWPWALFVGKSAQD